VFSCVFGMLGAIDITFFKAHPPRPVLLQHRIRINNAIMNSISLSVDFRAVLSIFFLRGAHPVRGREGLKEHPSRV
jgi:hypothetical protein